MNTGDEEQKKKKKKIKKVDDYVCKHGKRSKSPVVP
jgi:hypothetical protein